MIHILWLGIWGCFKFFLLGLAFPFVLWKAIREVEGKHRSNERIPAQVNVKNPSVIEAERIVEEYLTKNRKGRTNHE